MQEAGLHGQFRKVGGGNSTPLCNLSTLVGKLVTPLIINQ